MAQVIEVSLGIGMKPRLIMFGGLLRLVLTFGMIFGLAPIYGLHGVAFSALAGCVIQAFSIAMFVRRIATDTWTLKGFFPIIATGVFGGILLVIAQFYLGRKVELFIAWGCVAMTGFAGWNSYKKLSRPGFGGGVNA
jgi:hypothetical protein